MTAAAVAMMMRALYASALLPGKYLAAAAGGLVAMLLLVVLLTWNPKKKVRFTFGTILAIALALLLSVGASLINRTVKTVENITKPTVEYTRIGVFVQKDDPAQTIQDAKDYTFGILEDVDAENTQTALNEIYDVVGKRPETVTYQGLSALAEAFANGECQAVVLNANLLDLISELENMPEPEEWTRELLIIRIEVPLTIPPKEPVEIGPEEPTEHPVSEGVFSVYISGSDTRGELDIRGRSDVNIIAIVNPAEHQILLVTTPRDYYITLPFNGAWDKLTHAAIYGMDCSMAILGDLYDIDIDYYFRLNFVGFKNIINALGGVTVYSEYDFNAGGFHFVEGYNYIEGDAALWFARERYAFGAGDNQRGRNQLAVIRGVIKKVCSPAILTSYTSILDSLSGCFYTDVPYDVVAELVRDQINGGGEWDVVSVNATGYNDYDYCWSLGCTAYVMPRNQQSLDDISELVRAILRGERIEQP